ncbi:MAG TPA: serine racemase VanT catalytic subunit [Candidatus Faecivicinus avistercoris]|nr:serine racemase VanT catalytic subunit [Candidatus Faecivicinus avistercoris]
MQKKSFAALDAFRLIAALLVVAIHTSPLASLSPDADFLLTRVAGRLAVPFFFMVTGCFLLNDGGVRRFLGRTARLYALSIALCLPLNFYAGGMSAIEWLRGLLIEGTFYHLWYLPAVLLAVPAAFFLRKLRPWLGFALAGVLYLIGLGGDSWHGVVCRTPAIAAFYDGLLAALPHTRALMAPLFLLLGAQLPRALDALRTRTGRLTALCAACFAASLAIMGAEALWLRALGAPRHDSMTLALPLCAAFLFLTLLSLNGARCRAASEMSTAVYILHPWCIVLVRGFAKLTGTQAVWIGNSLAHFLLTAALSLALAAGWTAALRSLRRRGPRASLQRFASSAAEPPQSPRTVGPAASRIRLPRAAVSISRETSRAWREIDLTALCHNADALAAMLVSSDSRTGGMASPTALNSGVCRETFPSASGSNTDRDNFPSVSNSSVHRETVSAASGSGIHREIFPATSGSSHRKKSAAHRLSDRSGGASSTPLRALMAVVKADAYGHGAVIAARALWRHGVHAFAVATMEEGIELRRAGIRGTILVLGWTPAQFARRLARWHLSQTIADEAHARALSAQGVRLDVHLALDTGMHRLGVTWDDLDAQMRIFALPGLCIRGTFSHLSVADSLSKADVAFTREQSRRFFAAIEALRGRGCDPGLVHLQASYGILNHPAVPCDFARAGIALYGVTSDSQPTARTADLWPVLSLRARVASVRALAPGESAGYGRAFTARRPTKLAAVAIGYADGLPRDLPERGGEVLLHGHRAPAVGRLCMDQMLVDATDVPDVRPGDVATLIGRDGAAQISAVDLARQCGVLTNELLSRLGGRLGLRALR